MPQCSLAIQDNVTGFWLTGYNADPSLCQWGNASNAVCFDTWTLPAFNSFLNDLNNWAQATNRFVGQNPPPR